MNGYDLDRLTAFRQELHRHPELSGQEADTAKRIRSYINKHAPPDGELAGLGGHGLAFFYEGEADGPTVLLRADFDALPIDEPNDLPYKSVKAGISHKCGHDGHTAILCAVAEALSKERPKRGRAVLLFQPAEETGEGAAKVLADARFASEIDPEYAFALHNLPGYPLGHVLCRQGTMCAASEGAVARFHGRTSHSAEPHKGLSPARQINEMMNYVPILAQTESPSALATLVYARLGQKSFGIYPGEGEVCATLRGFADASVEGMRARFREIAEEFASIDRVGVSFETVEPFPATVNTERGFEAVWRGLASTRRHCERLYAPFWWSEDFGRFLQGREGALFGIGAGESQPELHHPEYDFPDALIGPGAEAFLGVLWELLG